MGSSNKSTETQLIALYRLEFYKNKENWKLYKDVRKEPPPSPKIIDDATRVHFYSSDIGNNHIQVKKIVDWSSLGLESLAHYSPRQQEYKSVECFGTDMASSNKSTETQLIALYRLEFYKSKENWKLYKDVRKEPPPSLKIIDKVNKTYNISKDFHELQYDADVLSPHNNAFLDEGPASHLELKPAEDPLDVHLEYLTPAQMRQTAEDWLTQHGVPVREEEYADMYDECGFADESADFVRGAHSVPHSSELELSVTQECPCTCNNSLCVFSVRQLARAIQRHHSALTLLLREQALRQRLSSRSLLHPPIPFEEYPTRDTDPLRSQFSSQRVLSASRHDAGTGRGLGRAQQHSVIGIRMGRPYRL